MKKRRVPPSKEAQKAKAADRYYVSEFQGQLTNADDPSEIVGIPDFEINDSFVEDPFHGADPFPEIIVPAEPTPAAPSATR